MTKQRLRSEFGSRRVPHPRRAARPGGGARCAALGRAELLGPGAASRAPGPLGRQGDPVPHRRRLSAAELRSRRRDADRLQCRDRAGDLRGARDRLHDPGAALRYADQFADDRQRRRGHRLDRGDSCDPRAGRFLDPLLPDAGALHRAKGGHARRRQRQGARRKDGRRRRRLLARGLSDGLFLGDEAEALPERRGAAIGPQGRRDRCGLRRRADLRRLAQRRIVRRLLRLLRRPL